MFEFIKKLTSKVVDIVPLEYGDDILQFHPVDNSKPLKPGELDASFTLPDGAVLKARLSVLSFDAEKGHYLASVLDPPEARETLGKHYPPPPPEEEEPSWVEKRTIPRLEKVFGVLSRAFPGFKGTTHDVTVEGARLVADGPVEAGTVLKFTLDLDDARLEPIPITADVIWTLPKNQRQHFIGVKFTEIGEKDLTILTAFIKECMEREHGVIHKDYQL